MKLAFAAAGTVIVLAALFAADLAAQTPQQRDRLLEQAGFIMRSADTGAKVERMKRLPPLQFLARNSPRGRYYLFADPTLCVCVFVGNEQAMENYKSQIITVPANELAPTQAAPGPDGKPYVIVHDVGEDLFGDPVEEDILEYRF